MFVSYAAKAALAVNTDMAENDDPSSEVFIVDLDKNVNGNSSAKVTLSSGIPKSRQEDAFKASFAHCVSIEGRVQELRG